MRALSSVRNTHTTQHLPQGGDTMNIFRAIPPLVNRDGDTTADILRTIFGR